MTAPQPLASRDAGRAVIEVRNLGLRFSDDFGVVIEDMYLQAGDIVVLDAPSGAGKSTVLGLLSGAIVANAFDVSKVTHSLGGHKPSNKGLSPDVLGFVLQTSALVPYLTVLENIRLPCDVAGIQPDTEWQAYLIRALGLAGLEDRKPSEVSVGQRQRAGIARAFLARPAVLLLDEPVSALDPSNVDQVEELIALLAEDSDAAVVLASHQAARGAFADAQRASQRVVERGGTVFSTFSMANAA